MPLYTLIYMCPHTTAMRIERTDAPHANGLLNEFLAFGRPLSPGVLVLYMCPHTNYTSAVVVYVLLYMCPQTTAFFACGRPLSVTPPPLMSPDLLS